MISRQDTGLQSSDMFPFLVDENSVFSNHPYFQVWVASHYQQKWPPQIQWSDIFNFIRMN